MHLGDFSSTDVDIATAHRFALCEENAIDGKDKTLYMKTVWEEMVAKCLNLKL